MINTKTNFDIEIWHSEDDKDVLLVTPEEITIANKKRILQNYLRKINENIASVELLEEKKNSLKELYNRALEKAKILSLKKCDVLQKKISDEIILKDKKYFETDDEGNLYVSDDI